MLDIFRFFEVYTGYVENKNTPTNNVVWLYVNNS